MFIIQFKPEIIPQLSYQIMSCFLSILLIIDNHEKTIAWFFCQRRPRWQFDNYLCIRRPLSFVLMCTVFVDWSLTIYYKFNLVKFNQQKLYWGRSKLIGLLQAATRSGSASHFLECALLKHFNTFFLCDYNYSSQFFCRQYQQFVSN